MVNLDLVSFVHCGHNELCLAVMLFLDWIYFCMLVSNVPVGC